MFYLGLHDPSKGEKNLIKYIPVYLEIRHPVDCYWYYDEYYHGI